MNNNLHVLRTQIYIDGYNLYYGRLRETPFKWLDVVALFSSITRSIEPHTPLKKNVAQQVLVCLNLPTGQEPI